MKKQLHSLSVTTTWSLENLPTSVVEQLKSNSCSEMRADDLWFNMASDDNGSFVSYVPAGDWVAIVAPFLADNDSTETLRYPFTVGDDSSVRTGLNLTSFDVIEVKFQLQEFNTEAKMSGIRVTLVSHDGFGNMTLSKSDANGNM